MLRISLFLALALGAARPPRPVVAPPTPSGPPPSALAAYRADCAADWSPPPAEPDEDPSLSWEPDPSGCRSLSDRPRVRCGDAAEACQAACADPCEGCKARCRPRDAACAEACAQGRVACGEACLSGSASCLAEVDASEDQCRDEFEQERARLCPDCAALSLCQERRYWAELPVEGCLTEFPNNDPTCLERCGWSSQ